MHIEVILKKDSSSEFCLSNVLTLSYSLLDNITCFNGDRFEYIKSIYSREFLII